MRFTLSLRITRRAARPARPARNSAQRKMRFHAVGVRFTKIEILSRAQHPRATLDYGVEGNPGWQRGLRTKAAPTPSSDPLTQGVTTLKPDRDDSSIPHTHLTRRSPAWSVHRPRLARIPCRQSTLSRNAEPSQRTPLSSPHRVMAQDDFMDKPAISARGCRAAPRAGRRPRRRPG